MPDETTQSAGQDAQLTNPSQQEGRIEDLPGWAQKAIRDLRDEAAQRRIALKTAQEEQQKRLAEEGNFKSLAEQLRVERDGLKPYEERAKTLEMMIREANTSRIARVQEGMRSLIPTDYSPESLSKWLDASWELLTVKPAPDIDAGAGGGGGTRAVILTAEEQALARRAGMTDAQYAQYKK